VVVILASVMLAAAVVLTASPLADRDPDAPGEQPMGGAADRSCLALLIASAVVLITSALVAGFAYPQQGAQPGALPGLTAFLAVLLAAQAALLIALTVAVVLLARRASAQPVSEGFRPFLGGGLAALIAGLGFWLGGLLTAVIGIGVTRLLGTPVPSGFRFDVPQPSALALPWPTYAFGIAPLGWLAGAVAAGILVFLRYRRRSAGFRLPSGTGPSPAAAEYAAATAGPPQCNGDQPGYKGNLRAIANAWSIGEMVDDVAAVGALALGGGMTVLIAAEVAAAVMSGPPGDPSLLAGWLHGLASLFVVVGGLVVGALVTLLRQAYSDPRRRRTIGAVWDVGTFWPRAVHPLAPPCYAERAIPELVDRIRLLSGRHGGPQSIIRMDAEAELLEQPEQTELAVGAGPVLVTGYSQGSAIATAVVAQLPVKLRSRVALLTLACPVRRLYGRAFPAYFGPSQLGVLRDLLDSDQGQTAGRWRNLCRHSDYIGSWIFAQPSASLTKADLAGSVDQPCLDPAVLVPDADPTTPPIHRHLAWWQDPRTHEVAAGLVRVFDGPATPTPPAVPSSVEPPPAEPPPAEPPPAEPVPPAVPAAGVVGS
jgi:hypothetical protein